MGNNFFREIIDETWEDDSIEMEKPTVLLTFLND